METKRDPQTVIGKVALVTGGSRGIGEAAARGLAKGNIKVVLAARSVDDMKRIVEDIKKNGGDAAYVYCDVEKETDIENSIKFAEETYGGVDFIFANAGWEGPLKAFKPHQYSSEEIIKLFNINLLSCVRYVKYGVFIKPTNE